MRGTVLYGPGDIRFEDCETPKIIEPTDPGARTARHTHPLGQILIVTEGFGWVQRDRGPIEEIRSGDVVWFAPSEKHRHGATPVTGMTHIAILEQFDGKTGDWLEKVTDDQYRKQV